MSPAAATRRRGERGQVSVLIVGLSVVVLMLVTVVVDASAAYLRRSGLDSLADGAALAAANGIEARQVYEHGVADRAVLDPALARHLAADYLTASGASASYPGLAYDVRVDRQRIVVRVAAPLHLPLAPPGFAHRTVVSGTAATYSQVSN